jgi:MFS family permease
MAVGLGVIGLTKSLEMTIVGNLISGLGVGIAVPNLFSYAATISSERDRARNIGLGRGACLAAPMLAQFALEPLSKAQGPTAAVAAIAVVALLGAAGFRMLTMDAPRPAMPEAPPA